MLHSSVPELLTCWSTRSARALACAGLLLSGAHGTLADEPMPLPLPTPLPAQHTGTVHPIVGGDDATTAAQPWIAALVSRAPTGSTRTLAERQRCGATLVDAHWVVTAAHCVQGTVAHELQVIIGREMLDATGGRVHDVAEVVVHPAYDAEAVTDDIAMLRLAQPSTAPVLALAPAGSTPQLHGKPADLYGWGNLFDEDSVACDALVTGGPRISYQCGVTVTRSTRLPPSLKHARLRVRNFADCRQRYIDFVMSLGATPPDDILPGGITAESPVLCAWHDVDTSAPCFGDSGGPLVGNVAGKRYLVGIVSYIQRGGCPLPFQIGYYVEASAYRDFVEQTMARDRLLAPGSLCPGRPRPRLTFGTPHNGRTRVDIVWDAVQDATAYSLDLVSVPASAAGPVSRRTPGPVTGFTTELASGLHFLVGVRAHGEVCDGPLSTVLEVKVP